MKKYYVVLTGAMKNAGDYLITEKCKELLRFERPDYELVQLNRWESLEDDLDIVNNSEALILMGGPAVTPELYPNIYKLTDNLDDITVPIIPMAVGWRKGSGTFQDMIDFEFSKESEKLLKKFNENGVGVSARDSYTANILSDYGINNVYLTGCSSWYTPSKFNQKLKDTLIESVAFTPAQNPKYGELSKQMMKLIRDEYPEQRLICAFHRGIGVVDDYTTPEDAQNTHELAEYAKKLDMEVIDLSYTYDNYQKYNDIDMHIGYRLHGHLYFLSNRKPSILLHEDGRGVAMSETIGLKGINVFNYSKIKSATDFSNRVFRKLNFSLRFNPEVRYESFEELKHLIYMHKATNYQFMNGVFENIDNNYAIMKKFLHKLP